MFFSVQTIDQVIVYSTESSFPICVIGNLHYAYITDMNWVEANKIMISSYDGYCSLISIDRKTTGRVLEPEEVKNEQLRNVYIERKKVEYN